MSGIYDRIKKRRQELGLTIEELAQKMGYKDKSSISKIENGKADIPQSKVLAFAKALHTTPAYLMGWADEPNQEKPPVNQADHERSNENDFFISEDIKTIVFCFNQLNAQGKAELIKYAQNLTYIPQYKKLSDADEEVG